MRTASWTWFWYFLFGFVAGGGVVWLRSSLKKKAIRFIWYEWIMSIAVLALLLLMVQTFIGSLEEEEFQAAWMSIVFLGVPMFLIAVGTYRSVCSRLKRE